MGTTSFFFLIISHHARRLTQGITYFERMRKKTIIICLNHFTPRKATKPLGRKVLLGLGNMRRILLIRWDNKRKIIKNKHREVMIDTALIFLRMTFDQEARTEKNRNVIKRPVVLLDIVVNQLLSKWISRQCLTSARNGIHNKTAFIIIYLDALPSGMTDTKLQESNSLCILRSRFSLT